MKLGFGQFGLCCLLLPIFFAADGCICCAEPGALRVGVAKVDITPSNPTQLTNVWETPFTGIHDKIYARAIILDNGISSAAIISVDTVEITNGTPIADRIAKETGIPASNIILAATRNHSAPMIGLATVEGQRKAGTGSAAFIAKVEDDLVAALRQAKANMQPARVGFDRGGAGTSASSRLSETASRVAPFSASPASPASEGVWVMKFETLSGEPLAVLANFSLHATVIGEKNTLLTGELPGATSRYVEQHYGNKVVALWTSGTADNQNPIAAISAPDGDQDFKKVDELGQILGESVIHIADSISHTTSKPRIWGMERNVACPGQRVIQNPGAQGKGGTHDGQNSPGGDVKIVDADPVHFRLGVLMVGDAALTMVSAEVVNKIYEEVRTRSPFTNTVMVILANGRSGFIADDAAYDSKDHSAPPSTFKRGCGESSVVNGLTDMLWQY